MKYKIVCKYVERTFVSWNNFNMKSIDGERERDRKIEIERERERELFY
jgi:hypothetical protein